MFYRFYSLWIISKTAAYLNSQCSVRGIGDPVQLDWISDPVQLDWILPQIRNYSG